MYLPLFLTISGGARVTLPLRSRSLGWPDGIEAAGTSGGVLPALEAGP